MFQKWLKTFDELKAELGCVAPKILILYGPYL